MVVREERQGAESKDARAKGAEAVHASANAWPQRTDSAASSAKATAQSNRAPPGGCGQGSTAGSGKPEKKRNPLHAAAAAAARWKKKPSDYIIPAPAPAPTVTAVSTPGAIAPGSAEPDDDKCQLCLGLDSTADNPIVLCGSDTEGCGKGWHLHCIGFKELPADDWFCNECAPQPLRVVRRPLTGKSASAAAAASGEEAGKQLLGDPSGKGGSVVGENHVWEDRASSRGGGLDPSSSISKPSTHGSAAWSDDEQDRHSAIESATTSFAAEVSPFGKRQRAESGSGHGKAKSLANGGKVRPGGQSEEMQRVGMRPKCKFCLRSFISQHAVDVHLTRNQVCRRQNQARKMKRKIDSLHRRPQARPLGEGDAVHLSAATRQGPASLADGWQQASGPRPLDLAGQIVSRLMQTAGAEPFNLPIDPTDADAKQYFQIIDPASAMDFATVKKKLASGSYASVHELRDDVLLIWLNCFRYYGPQSALYGQARVLSKKFDEQMSIRMDNVRGMGGRADEAVFIHGPQWVGQKVRIYSPKEHERISGQIEAHKCGEDDVHRYHVVFPDGNQEWRRLPDPHVELVGWVLPSEECLVGAGEGGDRGDAYSMSAGGGSGGSQSAVDLKRAVALKGWETRRKRQLADGRSSGPSKFHPTFGDINARKRKLVLVMRGQAGTKRQAGMLEPSSLLQQARHSSQLLGGTKGFGPQIRGGRGQHVRPGAVDTPASLILGLARQDFLPLVQELHEKVEYDLFDQPTDPKAAPGYYHANALPRQRGLTAWSTATMCFEQMADKAARGEYATLSDVERDFNLIISNALIYYAHWHMANRQARKLYQAGSRVIDKWAQRKGSYSCSACHKDDVVNNAMLICDQCCRGVHESCLLKSGAKSLLLLSQEVVHPLRADSAFLCSQECVVEFTSLAAHYKLSPLYSTPPERNVSFVTAHCLAHSLSHSLSSSAGSAKELAAGRFSNGLDKTAFRAASGVAPSARASGVASSAPAFTRHQAELAARENNQGYSSAEAHGEADTASVTSPRARFLYAQQALEEAIEELPMPLSLDLIQEAKGTAQEYRRVISLACGKEVGGKEGGGKEGGGKEEEPRASQEDDRSAQELEGVISTLCHLLAARQRQAQISKSGSEAKLAVHTALEHSDDVSDQLLEVADRLETEYRASELGIRALAETFLLHSQFFTGQSSHHRCKTAAASMSVDPEEKFSRKADKGW